MPHISRLSNLDKKVSVEAKHAHTFRQFPLVRSRCLSDPYPGPCSGLPLFQPTASTGHTRTIKPAPVRTSQLNPDGIIRIQIFNTAGKSPIIARRARPLTSPVLQRCIRNRNLTRNRWILASQHGDGRPYPQQPAHTMEERKREDVFVLGNNHASDIAGKS